MIQNGSTLTRVAHPEVSHPVGARCCTRVPIAVVEPAHASSSDSPCTGDIAIAPDAPCNAVVVGQPGTGKSTLLDLCAWRIPQLGGRVLVIGGQQHRHRVLLPIASAAGYGVARYTQTDTRIDMHASLMVMEDTASRPHLPWGAMVQRLSYTQETRCERTPLVVMLDEVNMRGTAPALMAAAATWPALQISLWVVTSRAEDLCHAATLPVQSLWASARLRVWCGTVADDGTSPMVPVPAADQKTGQVVLWQPGFAQTRGWVRARNTRERSIIAAR